MKKERLYFNKKTKKDESKLKELKEKRMAEERKLKEMEAYDGDSEEIEGDNENRMDNEDMEKIKFVTVYIKDLFCK